MFIWIAPGPPAFVPVRRLRSDGAPPAVALEAR